MIIIRKNKIVVGIVCIMLFTTVYMLIDYLKIKTVETSTWSKTGKIVIIDARTWYPGRGSL